MNYLQRERVHVEGRVGRIASVLVVGALSCLPADDLASYSNGKRPLQPAEGSDLLAETPPGDPLATGEAAVPAAAPGAAPGGDCGSECATPALSIGPEQEDMALGSASSSDGAASDGSESEHFQGDAGVQTPDAGASAADAGASRCVPGSIVGPEQRCFELVSALNSWAAARTRCQSNGPGWDLTTIRTAARNAWLSSLLGSITDAWVGASDTQTEGSWRWLGDSAAFWNGLGTAGSAVGNAYESWSDGAPAEPNGGDASDCLRLRPGGNWADFQCATAYASICEGPQR